jgi:hypothetical protein
MRVLFDPIVGAAARNFRTILGAKAGDQNAWRDAVPLKMPTLAEPIFGICSYRLAAVTRSKHAPIKPSNRLPFHFKKSNLSKPQEVATRSRRRSR